MNQKVRIKTRRVLKTNVWNIFAGGGNCMHSILPVSTYSVPHEVIQRNLDNGNYKEAA